MKRDKRVLSLITAALLCGCTAAAPADTQAATPVQTDAAASEVTEAVSETSTETTSDTVSETETSEETSQTESVTETPAASDIDLSYKDAYTAKLREIIAEHEGEDMSTFMFSVYDVGGDSTPELLVSEGDWHASSAQLFALADGKVEFIDYVGSYGEAIYMTGKGYFDNANGGMGSFYNMISTFDGNKLVNGLSIEGYNGPDYRAGEENVDYDNMVELYYIDGEETTKEEYYKAYEENFEGRYVNLGRNFYLNEHGISAVFGDSDEETAFDELILSLPTEGEQWGVPDKMAQIDVTADGTKELVLSNEYRCDVYSYDKGVKYSGSIPSGDFSPYDYFGMMDLDVDYSSSGETEYTLLMNDKQGTLVWREHDLSDRFYLSEFDAGALYAKHVYQALKLSDGTFFYTVDGRQAEEYDYDNGTQQFFADEYKEVEFVPVAVG